MAQVLVEKLKRTGPAIKERVALAPQSEQLARTQELPMGKKKNRAISSDHKVMR